MLSAKGAKTISTENYELNKDSIEYAITQAAKDGQFRVEFDYRRWPGVWAEEWLEELGYDVNYLHGPHYASGCVLEISWL